MPSHRAISQSVQRRAAMRAIGTSALLALFGSQHRARAAEPALLRIGGTGMALATMRQIGDGFTATQPEIVVRVLPSLGTGGGLAAVADAAIELALSARAPNEAERGKGLQSLAYTRTPIAFAGHHALGVRNVTLSQVAQILGGTLFNWPDGTPVRLVRREPSDADWTMLRSLSAEMATAVAAALARPGLLTVGTDQENAETLERLPGSFGAISVGQARAENRNVVLLDLDGVTPDVAGIAAERYRLSRTLYVAWRDPPKREVAALLAFLRSEAADQILIRLDQIPLAGMKA